MHDLLFVSMENWDEIWRRNQFVVAALSRRFPNQKILFVGLARDFSHALRKRDFASLRSETLKPLPDFPNVYLTNAPKYLPNTIPLCRRINEATLRRHLKKAARRLQIKTPILWLNPHSAVHLVGQMGESGSVYDITDDWTQFSSKAQEKQLIIAQDKALCRRANATIVCSPHLFALKKQMARRLFLIQNGVDVEHYQRVAHTRLSSTRNATFGYTGSIHQDRVDVDLIMELARAFPDGRVVLVGPNMLPSEKTAQLQAQPNIEVRGAVPYKSIPEAMSSFDVCVVPHVETPFTESLNPIKLWEYLAAGKPIVSTNVAGFRDFVPLCRVASGADGFVQQCREAAEEAASDDRSLIEARQSEAAKHGWKSRVDEVVGVLESIEN